MGNKLLKRACTLLAKDPSIATIDQFWAKLGLTEILRGKFSPPVLDEVGHVAARVLAARADGAEPKKRPKPLREFVFVEHCEGWVVERRGKRTRVVLPTGRFRHFHLHPTKGWRSNAINRSEAEYAVRERKVSCRDEKLAVVPLPKVA